MNIPRPLLLIFFIFIFMSCYSQNEEATNYKILEINNAIQIFYPVSEIDLEDLENRKTVTNDERFETLKKSISKENLNNKTIKLFNKYFNPKEIDELYEEAKNHLEQQNLFLLDPEPNQIKTSLSPELKKKRDSIYPILIKEGYKTYQKFKHQLYVLDSIN